MTVAQWDDKGALLDEGALWDERQGRAERRRDAAAVRGPGTCHGYSLPTSRAFWDEIAIPHVVLLFSNSAVSRGASSLPPSEFSIPTQYHRIGQHPG